jgi:hypothetical protein
MGAMRSPRYRPAGLLVSYQGHRVMVDGGPEAEPPVAVEAWLVTDERGELIAAIRRLARARGLEPAVASYRSPGLFVAPRPVVHTSHPAYGYLIEAPGLKAAWAPEFWRFPDWAEGVDLMFAEAAGWDHPIRFAGGVGGHASALDVARTAQERRVRRLVLAHVGRPTIRALDAGRRPPFGEVGQEGHTYVLRTAGGGG